MTGLAVTGWGAVCSAGVGPGALAAALARGRDAGRDVSGLYSEPLPSSTGHALVDFNVRELLGRKGTAFLNRCTELALVACGQALEDSGIRIGEDNRHRVGVVLGTTSGSVRSMSDYTRETLVEDRPYLVNPVLFPNTVMNCAAGQAAIRYGLKGVNSTVAGGRLAFLGVLRYANKLLRHGHADALLAGAVEEFTLHTAWEARLVGSTGPAAALGEGAAVFVVEPADAALRAGRHRDAEVLAVVTGFSPGGMTAALEGCIRQAIDRANLAPGDISLVTTGETGDEDRDRVEAGAVRAALRGASVERIHVKKAVGECQAASGALQLAAALCRHRDDASRDGQVSLITSWTNEGGVGAAVLRGWSRVGSHRG